MNGTETAIALRLIADWFAAHPDIAGPFDLTTGNCPDTLEEARRYRDALGAGGYVEDDGVSAVIVIARDFGGLPLRFLFKRSKLVGPLPRVQL